MTPEERVAHYGRMLAYLLNQNHGTAQAAVVLGEIHAPTPEPKPSLTPRGFAALQVVVNASLSSELEGLRRENARLVAERDSARARLATLEGVTEHLLDECDRLEMQTVQQYDEIDVLRRVHCDDRSVAALLSLNLHHI
jgi:hypothetical protein